MVKKIILFAMFTIAANSQEKQLGIYNELISSGKERIYKVPPDIYKANIYQNGYYLSGCYRLIKKEYVRDGKWWLYYKNNLVAILYIKKNKVKRIYVVEDNKKYKL